MSSRVLRKLGLQTEKDLIIPGDEASDTEADFSSGGTKKKLNLNRYDLLNQQSHSESEVKEDDDHETTGSINASEAGGENKDAQKRKKKKKKKKCSSKAQNPRSSEDNFEDEVERSVREVNQILGEPCKQATPASEPDVFTSSNKIKLLAVEPKFLNANNELKRMFGSRVVHAETNSKRKSRGRAHVKQTILVNIKDTWPPVGKPGISMKLLNKTAFSSDGSILQFVFEHSVQYQQVQMKFLEAVESLNPDNIVMILNSNSYHVDALLQLSELCRHSEDFSMAADLVERALYCFESCFHPSFNMTSPNTLCRLDYCKQENRGFFIALFKHTLSVGNHACYRTALELCKVILSLDPETDPLAVILLIDFYALRAQEYDWLIRFYNEWEPDRNLSQLPNFKYSMAIAHFQNNDPETAHVLLQEALIMFPMVLLPLLEKCAIQPDSRVQNHPFFTGHAPKTTSPSLQQLVSLYVERSYHVWKESELLPWLERNVLLVLDQVDKGLPCVEEAKQKRQRLYQATIPRSILRHVVLSDVKNVTAIIPEDTRSPIFNFDPLPPLDSVNLYTRPNTSRIGVIDNPHTLSIFFRSFMPTFNVNQAAQEAAVALPDVLQGGGAEGGAVEGAGGIGGVASASVDLRRSVNSLIDAMRDLLSNIHMPDVQDDGDVEDEED
uniref:Transcription factor 25 n=1 Tax=Cacopsylla melanoneura TaxID=428564 RepID=A0A8D8S1J2_9HEMI